MYILILGCDMLGAQLAADLAEEGHRITVMDARPDCFDGLHYGPNVDAVLTSESLIDDLRSVGINNVDAFFAVSADDTRNVMAAQVASHIFHVSDVICRISDPQREKFYRGLGINVVCPTLVLVNALKGAFLNGESTSSGSP
jgi:trk system potassium uptake protein TrkA